MKHGAKFVQPEDLDYHKIVRKYELMQDRFEEEELNTCNALAVALRPEFTKRIDEFAYKALWKCHGLLDKIGHPGKVRTAALVD